MSGFAGIATPLHRLTEHGEEFLWTEECETAFERLKDILTSTPVLAYPNTTDMFVLDTDASGTCLGAVLSQVQDGTEKVVAYYSKVLSRTERNYCVTRRELLAVVAAIRHFHHYLFGRHFLIRTDHHALNWLMSFRNPEGQIARWLEVLGNYDFVLKHHPGKQHGNADALSRRSLTCEECQQCLNAERRDLGREGIQGQPHVKFCNQGTKDTHGTNETPSCMEGWVQ